MTKVKVASPLVEMKRDEMAQTQTFWQWVRNPLILPFVDVQFLRQRRT